jgi:hypothetical protein
MAKKIPIDQHVVRTSITSDRETFERIEAWRNAQKPPIARATAWRELASRALDAENPREGRS